MMTVRVAYGEHIVQIDFGNSTAHHVKDVAPDLQKEFELISITAHQCSRSCSAAEASEEMCRHGRPVTWNL